MKITFEPFVHQFTKNPDKFSLTLHPENVHDLRSLQEIFSRGPLKVRVDLAIPDGYGNPGDPYPVIYLENKDIPRFSS